MVATSGGETASLLHLTGSKYRAKMGSQLVESASAGVTSKFARAQLEKMGWKQGEGLGKRNQGIKTHIKVVKRADGIGLGESSLDYATQQTVLGGGEWWKHSVGDTLAKLSSKKKNKKKRKSKKEPETSSKDDIDEDDDDDDDDEKPKKKKRVYTDEELFEATGGARFGMRAQTQQHGKWKRAEKGISETDELDAKSRVEWDGMNAPVVVLKMNEKKKKNNSKNDIEKSEKVEKATADDDGDDKVVEELKVKKTPKDKKKKKDKKSKKKAQ